MTVYGTNAAPLSDKHVAALSAPNVSDTVFINSYGAIEIVNETGTDRIYVTLTPGSAPGPAPVVAGDNTYEVPASLSSLVLPASIGKTFAVQLVSATVQAYSVMSELKQESSS